MMSNQQTHGVHSQRMGALQSSQRAGGRSPRSSFEEVRVGLTEDVHGIYGGVDVLLGEAAAVDGLYVMCAQNAQNAAQ